MAEGRRSAERAVRRAAESLAQVSPEADASCCSMRISCLQFMALSSAPRLTSNPCFQRAAQYPECTCIR